MEHHISGQCAPDLVLSSHYWAIKGIPLNILSESLGEVMLVFCGKHADGDKF